jgi:hypothetical protein
LGGLAAPEQRRAGLLGCLWIGQLGAAVALAAVPLIDGQSIHLQSESFGHFAEPGELLAKQLRHFGLRAASGAAFHLGDRQRRTMKMNNRPGGAALGDNERDASLADNWLPVLRARDRIKSGNDNRALVEHQRLEAVQRSRTGSVRVQRHIEVVAYLLRCAQHRCARCADHQGFRCIKTGDGSDVRIRERLRPFLNDLVGSFLWGRNSFGHGIHQSVVIKALSTATLKIIMPILLFCFDRPKFPSLTFFAKSARDSVRKQ